MIAHQHRANVIGGDIVVHEAQQTSRMYFINAGRVRIYVAALGRAHIKELTAEEALNMSGALGSHETLQGWVHTYPSLSYKDSVELGKILRRLGCTRDKHPVRKDGKRRRWWHPPDTGGTGGSIDRVPGQTPAVATVLSHLAQGTSDSSKKESLPTYTPAMAAALLGKTPVPPVPGDDLPP